jgi:hypothetical protein
MEGFVEGLLFGAKGTDPGRYIAVSLVLLLTAAISC